MTPEEKIHAWVRTSIEACHLDNVLLSDECEELTGTLVARYSEYFDEELR